MSVEVADQRVDRLLGEVLASRYLIEHRLGEGAMGAVYRARHVKVGRPFAVKVLHRKLLEDKKTALRFEREAELAGRLRHPNVVGVVDVGETSDGLRYMVMDFAEGDDLATMLDEAPMQPARITNLVRQLLEGLYHAHEAGLIHRDFKPENVIIEKDDHGVEVPRIVDFGIAILREGGDSTDSEGRLTTNGLVLGTPHYMAPEQAVADPIDHRIDLFALGIVVYEMLCGKLPFDGSGAEIARANLLLDPPPIAQRVPYLEVDPLLEAFARRLMHKKREARPATAKAARELLDLIERDRTAAASALGVPQADASRGPAVTQPVTPQRPVLSEPPAMYFERPQSPSPLEAPPASSAQLARANEHAISTGFAEPLAFGEPDARPRRRTWWFVGGAGGAAIVAAIAIGASGQSADTGSAAPGPPAEDRVVMPVTPPSPEPAPPPPAAAPTAEPVVTAEPIVPAPAPETETDTDTDTDTGSAVEPPGPATPPVRVTQVAKAPTRTRSKPLHTEIAKAEPPKAEPRPELPKAEPKPAPPKVAETRSAPPKPESPAGAVTAKMVGDLFKVVGRELGELGRTAGPGVSLEDLWTDYNSRTSIFNQMKDQASIDATYRSLVALRKRIADRGKR